MASRQTSNPDPHDPTNHLDGDALAAPKTMDRAHAVHPISALQTEFVPVTGYTVLSD
jgi:hypothetical protein